MDYKYLLNNFNRITFSLKNYLDFIGYKVPVIRALDNYDFKPEHYKYLKAILLEDGFYIDTSILVNALVKKHSILKDKNIDEIVLLLRRIKLTKIGDDVAKSIPKLTQSFNEWKEKNERVVNEIMQIDTSRYKRYGEQIKMLETMIKNKTIPYDSNVKVKLARYNDYRKTKLGYRIKMDINKKFIEELTSDANYIITFSNKRYVKLNKPLNLIVNHHLLYYYFTKMFTDKYSEGKDDERHLLAYKEYIERYLTKNEQFISQDNTITIPCENTYIDDKEKVCDVSEFKKIVNQKTLKKS